MLKYWGRAFVLLLISILHSYAVAARLMDPSDFPWFILEMQISYILCICFFMIAIVKQSKENISGYVIFACTDAVLAAAFTLYAIINIFVESDVILSMLGALLLNTVVRVTVWLFILNMIVWLCSKLKRKVIESIERQGIC